MRGRPLVLAVALAAAAAAAAGAAPVAGAAAVSLRLGFSDGGYSQAGPLRTALLDSSVAAGADIVRVDVGWDARNVPVRPPGFDALNPADPNYDFSRADAAIKDATAHGLQVLATFTGAPRWAEGPDRPADARPGTWKPDPVALGQYGAALARRYSGRYPDPAQPGSMLPRVAAFEVWNEPNLSIYLRPQWDGDRPASPPLYRRMLTRFYNGVKSVDPSATVVAGGTAPFGDPEPGGERMMPVRFWRTVLCVGRDGRRVNGPGCDVPARFDALAHHPYPLGSPTTAAHNADDATVPDLGKLTKIMRAAERTGGALPDKRHGLWVTETAYDSNPPDPDGVPSVIETRWVALMLYEFWRQGVSAVTWFQVRDALPIPSYAATSQSGLYFHDGRPKRAVRAFLFPVVVVNPGQGLRVWGRAPAGGLMRLQRRAGSRWVVVRTVRVTRHATFDLRVAGLHPGMSVRATAGGSTSAAWQIR